MPKLPVPEYCFDPHHPVHRPHVDIFCPSLPFSSNHISQEHWTNFLQLGSVENSGHWLRLLEWNYPDGTRIRFYGRIILAAHPYTGTVTDYFDRGIYHRSRTDVIDDDVWKEYGFRYITLVPSGLRSPPPSPTLVRLQTQERDHTNTNSLFAAVRSTETRSSRGP